MPSMAFDACYEVPYLFRWFVECDLSESFLVVIISIITIIISSLSSCLLVQTQRVCFQLPTYADNVALPHSPALMQQSIEISLLPAWPTAANAPHATAAGEWDRQRGGQTDGHCTVT